MRLNSIKYLNYLVLAIVLGACAPKYGAHFQSTNGGGYNTQKVFRDLDRIHSTDQPHTDTWSNVTATVDDNVIESPLVQIIKKHSRRVQSIQLSDAHNNEVNFDVKLSKRDFKKEIKAEFKKELRRAKEAGDGDYTLMMILGILIAPLGVGLTYGIGPEFWISLILFLLFWLPGAIYGGIKVHQFFRG